MTAPHGARETSTLRALVVDDHPLFCDALSMTLRAVLEIDEIATADNLAAALACLLDTDILPDILFLDLNLPDVNRLDGLLRLRAAAPGVPIVVVSSMTEPKLVAACLRAGAAGYIPKNAARETFRVAFDAIRSGGTFVPETLVRMPLRHGAEDAVERLGELTNQQARILSLICAGKLNKQIAHDLSIAETTVKAHVTAIMRKLRVQSRTQAVLVAQAARFSEPAP